MLKTPKTPVGGKVAKGALGLSAAGVIATSALIVPWEGNILKPYLDIGGVPTACAGVTGPEITKAYNEGRVFTKQECENLNMRAVVEHEVALRELINDTVEDGIPPKTMAAFISWTYNVGQGAAKNSTLIKLVNASCLDKECKELSNGVLEAACGQLSRWVYVKGRFIKGLANRRISEKALCLEGLNKNPWWGV